MAGGQKRSPVAKRPVQLVAFSPLARSLLFSSVSSKLPLPDASPAAKTPRENGGSDRNPPPPFPPKRAKRVESSSDDDNYDDDDEETSEEQGLETVQAVFAFFDPKPGDFHGVKLLLQRYLDSKPWDLTGFVDLILAQTTVGTVVKLADTEEEGGDGTDGNGNGESTGDDEDLFGFISALNLGRYGEHRCIKELKEFLPSVCGDVDKKKKLKLLLEEQASDVGLLVCRRFVNFPYELVPKLYDALFDEILWATEDEPTQELRDSFCFKHYLMVTRIFEKKSIGQRRAKNKQDQDEPIIYPMAEDEIFYELSSWTYTFPVQSEQSAQHEMKNYKEMGLVMAVKAEAVSKFREKLESLVSES